MYYHIALWLTSPTQVSQGQSEVLTGLHCFLKDAGKNLFSCLFWFLEAACIPRLTYPFLHLQRQQWPVESFSHGIPSPTLLPPTSLFIVPRDCIGPAYLLLGSLHVLWSSLNSSCKLDPPLPCHMTYSRVPGLGRAHLWGLFVCLPHLLKKSNQ